MTRDEYLDYWRYRTSRIHSKKLTYQGLHLELPPKIFDPDPEITESTNLILNSMPNLESKFVWDLGCGSGIIGMQAVSKGASFCISSDVENSCLNAVPRNAHLNDMSDKLAFILSDYDNNIRGKFNCIFANLPILGTESMELHNKVLRSYRRYLLENGRIYLSFASFGNAGTLNTLNSHPNLEDVITSTKFGIDWFVFILN